MMAVSLYDRVKYLFEQQLYSNTITLASMIISIHSNNGSEYVNPQEDYQIHCYYGDSLFHTHQYYKAEGIYKKALQIHKSLMKSRNSANDPRDIHSDIEIKYKLHQCYKFLKQTQNAIDILQSIPAKLRSPKVNMSLGEMNESSGSIRPATTFYREVLRACPLSLEAAEKLLALNVKPKEVHYLMSEGTSNTEGSDLITSFINARAHVHAKEYAMGARALRLLDTPPSLLRNWPHLLVCLGEVLYYGGDYKEATVVLARAHSVDTTMQRGLGVYAASLSKDGRLKDCADRITPMSSTLPLSQYTAEEWLVLAHIQADRKQWPKAALFAQKACHIDPKNPEGLLLKGQVLLEMKKFAESARHFRDAIMIAPGRFEGYAGLAESQLLLRRPREATAVAAGACKQLSNCCRALTLYANILLKEGSAASNTKAKELLEKVLMQDEKYLPAALTLAKILETDDDPQSSIDLLERQAASCPTAALHQALGEAWAKRSASGNINYSEKALLHFNAALALDPNNRKVLEAVSKLDRGPLPNQTGNSQSGGDEDTTYDIGGDGNIPSDQSIAPEESETEAMWSDMDLEVND